jgi:hypothetical protein
MKTYLLVGGLVAAGFDPSGAYLLTISHSGRGVFSTRTWQRVARDYELAYPDLGVGIGIGPIEGQRIPITQMNFETGIMQLSSADDRIVLRCDSSGITVNKDDVAGKSFLPQP